MCQDNPQNIHQQFFIDCILILLMKSSRQSYFEDLAFEWFSARINDVSSCQGIVHQSGLHCLLECLHKLLATGRVALKYYLLFHAVPMLTRLRKCKTLGDAAKAVRSTALEYLKSTLFLSVLVGLERGMLCLLFNQSQANSMTSSKIIVSSALASSAAIFFEQSSRRKEIVYFVSAKALRSAYVVLKRTLGFRCNWEAHLMHCALMAALYYLYNHKPHLLKFRSLFELIFGDS